MSNGPEGKTARGRPAGVLDPNWEDALRAGQAADGMAGSVDDELAVVHLLRHAAAPEALGDEALETIWGDLEPQVAPAPWWKGLLRWRVLGPALAAAGAAVVIAVVWPSEAPKPEPQVASADAPAGSPAELLATQFEILAPPAREGIAHTVDAGRGTMRGELLVLAAGDGKTAGGAP